MSKREAALILGITPNVKTSKLKEAHKKIMIANHPDRGTLFIITIKNIWSPIPFAIKFQLILNRLNRNTLDCSVRVCN